LIKFYTLVYMEVTINGGLERKNGTPFEIINLQRKEPLKFD